MSFYRDQLEDYLSGLHIKAESVLDIGGAAKPVKKRVASWDVSGQYAILDNFLEPRTEPYPFEANETWIEADIQYWHSVKETPEYEMVFCLEVMEYIFDPMSCLNSIAALTKRQGKLIITFPFVYPVHKPIEADYLRYTPQGATKLLAEAGFKTEAIHSRIDRSGKLLEFYKADGMHVGGNAHVTGVIIEARKV